MSWLTDFYYGTGTYGADSDYGKRGFVLPNGQYRTPRSSLQTHTDLAKEIVQGNEKYLAAYKKMEEIQEESYFYFLLALGCIATDNYEAAYGAIIASRAVIRNEAKPEIVSFNSRKNRDIEYVNIDDKYLEALQGIWQDLTKGPKEKDGR